jgi:tellurium resistance protein TerD
MALNLEKLEKNTTLNLTKKDDMLTEVKAILYWTAPKTGVQYDLDVSAFGLRSTISGPKILSEEWVVFYNQPAAPNSAITKSPDEREGGTEELYIHIAKLPEELTEVSVVITIHNAAKWGQNFGQITEAGIRIVNAVTNEDLAVYDLDEDFRSETAVQVGSFYKKDGEFLFQAIGAGYQLGLQDFIEGYS